VLSARSLTAEKEGPARRQTDSLFGLVLWISLKEGSGGCGGSALMKRRFGTTGPGFSTSAAVVESSAESTAIGGNRLIVALSVPGVILGSTDCTVGAGNR
jgi:hypothetical protein